MEMHTGFVWAGGAAKQKLKHLLPKTNSNQGQTFSSEPAIRLCCAPQNVA